MKPVRLAIIGATGLVGRTTLDVLVEWRVPLQSLRLFASAGSTGRTIDFNGESLALERLERVPDDLDAAIFATSSQLSAEWVPRFRSAGILTIDHSSHFRMDADVPLVIPEINGNVLSSHQGLIANPNCSASIALLPLAAIDRAAGMKTVIVDTYQSVSGSGQDAVTELDEQLSQPDLPPRVYPRSIAHNVFPQIGPFSTDGACDEEQKVVNEIRKILDRPDLPVLTTTVRVPVRIGHSAAVTVECVRSVSKEEMETAFEAMGGMIYERDTYRTPREIAGKQEVYVGRLRMTQTSGCWFQFWAVGDNLRKGAASNAVQILMEVFK